MEACYENRQCGRQTDDETGTGGNRIFMQYGMRNGLLSVGARILYGGLSLEKTLDSVLRRNARGNFLFYEFFGDV